ncbi:helix-turn-helix transcriptional regulator [Lactiplantibacillus pentosus]|uniref:helix-turn-helix transcriptional regulator n=1 Tax=Lactiplantibacillus pentosus TaxID=1589 RepID=UPI0021821F27|nr:helix-turn-helix transcriptional regulator [Lactiplantibacillus pentosus]MCT0162890.1 XRE family transcriptional regulator [Lactiplantibacillus pentosus]
MLKPNNLKKIREQNGLTQRDLALVINVDQRTISKWEHGISVPSVAIMQLLEDYFDVKKELLFYGAFNYKKLLKIEIKQRNEVKLYTKPKEAAK